MINEAMSVVSGHGMQKDIFAGTLSVTNGTAGWEETYYGEPGTIFRGQLFPGGTVFVAR